MMLLDASDPYWGSFLAQVSPEDCTSGVAEEDTCHELLAIFSVDPRARSCGGHP